MTNNTDWINVDKIDFDRHIGFIYRITNLSTGKQYIGKKLFTHTIKKKLTKKELSLLEGKRGKKPVKKTVKKSSNWESYWGSCQPLLDDIKLIGVDNFKREILYGCCDKQSLSYLEIRCQMEERVIENENGYYNSNVLGKFYPNKIKNYDKF